MIPGFELALRKLNPGDEAKIFVRSDMAYGKVG